MRAFVSVTKPLSKAMDRVVDALKLHAPSDITITEDREMADIVLVHTIGYPETIDIMDELLSKGKRYIIAQYCLRSTQRPHTSAWLPIWRSAEFVWSYYDLPRMIAEDGLAPDPNIQFYKSPLGVDPGIFNRPSFAEKRHFMMFTSGYVAESETVREAARACEETESYMLHLGPEMDLGKHVHYFMGISDLALAKWLRNVQFVAGLRRCEGFELPAAEGLLCGARPICYDRPHYRDWYNDFAEFIPETDFHTVRDHLVGLFREGARPVTDAEIEKARQIFSWPHIVERFWNHVRVSV